MFDSIFQSQQNDLLDNNTKLSYRYTNISLDPEDKYSILLRSVGHGVDQEGKNISITIKNEYVPEAGSQKIDDEESLWNWITATLKGSTEHLNMHIFPQNGHCLQIKRSDPKRVFSDFTIKLKQLFVF